jgi:hypothetical protein
MHDPLDQQSPGEDQAQSYKTVPSLDDESHIVCPVAALDNSPMAILTNAIAMVALAPANPSRPNVSPSSAAYEL